MKERDYFSAVMNRNARVNHSCPESGQQLLNAYKPLGKCKLGFTKRYIDANTSKQWDK